MASGTCALTSRYWRISAVTPPVSFDSATFTLRAGPQGNDLRADDKTGAFTDARDHHQARAQAAINPLSGRSHSLGAAFLRVDGLAAALVAAARSVLRRLIRAFSL